MRACIALILIVVLSACTPNPLAAGPTETPTPDLSYTNCGWQWAYERRDDITARWQDELDKLGLPIINDGTFARAFGENCLGPNGEIIRFATMEIDFTVALNVLDFDDLNERAKLVEPIIRLVIDSFPPSSLSAPNKGLVEFHFISSMQDGWARIRIDAAERVFAEGKTGIDFYNEVMSQP